MQIKITLTKKDLLELIRAKFQEHNNTPRPVKDTEISVKVKSKQNYKSEWEEAEFMAEVCYDDRFEK